MNQQWRIVHQTKSSSLKRLWVFEGGLWQPTDRYAWDGRAMPVIAGGMPDTIDKAIVASGDDGGVWTEDGGFSSTGSNAYLGCRIGTYGQGLDYFRFVGLTMSGASIASYMRFFGLAGPTGSPQLRIYGIDEENPIAPTSAGEFYADPLTDAYVNWTSGFAYGWKATPSLNAIVDELLDKHPFENAAIMFQVRDTKNEGINDWSISLWDPDGTVYPPELHIEFGPKVVIPRSPGYGFDPMIF